jgi:hypothetical protein
VTDQFDPAEVADFDAFRKERDAAEQPGARLRLYGQTYVLPTQVPLRFVLLEERNKDREDLGAIREVLEPVYGPDALDEWADAGMGYLDFETILAWTAANMRDPGAVSLAEAAETVAREEEQRGKASVPANREQRRAATKSGSKKPKKRSSGGRS